MKTMITLIIVLVALSGCQLDIQGPSASAKLFYETENGGDVYKSRGSGMAGGNSYASDGGRMQATGDSAKVSRMLSNFFNTSEDRILTRK